MPGYNVHEVFYLNYEIQSSWVGVQTKEQWWVPNRSNSEYIVPTSSKSCHLRGFVEWFMNTVIGSLKFLL